MSDKAPYIIYSDLQCLIKIIDTCKNNFKKSSTTNIDKHIPSGYSVSMIWTFDGIKNNHNAYKVEDCMVCMELLKFCEYSR